MVKAFGCVFFAPILAALSCGGESSESPITEAGLDGEALGCEAPGTLELTLVSMMPTKLQTPPAAIAHLDDTTFLALDRTGEVFRVGPDTKELETPGSLVVAGLGTFPGGAVGFTPQMVFWHSPRSGGWNPLDSGFDLTNVRAVVSGGRNESSAWIIDGPEEARRILLVGLQQVEAPTFSLLDSWSLPGSWRLVALGSDEAVAISTRAPFQLMKLRRGSAVESMGALGAVDIPGTRDAEPAVFVSGVVGLDCGALLVTLADLRSAARRLVVVDVGSGEILKRARIDATMSFFASNRPERSLFAYHDTKSGGEVLKYRWAWKEDGELKDLEKKEGT